MIVCWATSFKEVREDNAETFKSFVVTVIKFYANFNVYDKSSAFNYLLMSVGKSVCKILKM